MLGALRPFVSWMVVMCASAPLAADVITVTPASDLQGAVDHAGPFDVILMAPGNYSGTVLVDGKGLSLVADGGSVSMKRLVVRHVPVGETFTLEGVSLANNLLGVFEPSLLVRDNPGAVRVQSCTITGHGGITGTWVSPTVAARDGTEAARIVNSASVSFHDSTLRGGGGATLEEETFEAQATGGGDGLVVTNSTVLVFASTVRGGSGGSILDTVTSPGGRGGDAIRNQEGGRVQVHGSLLEGGGGGSGDCSVFNCGSGGSGGDGVEQVDAGSSVIVRDVLFEPGVGGFSGDGSSQNASGMNLRILDGVSGSYTAPYRDFAGNSPVREGGTLTLDVAGQPGDVLLLFAGIVSGHVNMPFRQGVFLIGTPLVLPGVFLGALPGSGALSAPLVIPEMGPGIVGFDLHLQMAFDSGSDVLLGPAQVITLLDAAF